MKFRAPLRSFCWRFRQHSRAAPLRIVSLTCAPMKWCCGSQRRHRQSDLAGARPSLSNVAALAHTVPVTEGWPRRRAPRARSGDRRRVHHANCGCATAPIEDTVLELDVPRNVGEALAQITTVAAAIGKPANARS